MGIRGLAIVTMLAFASISMGQANKPKWVDAQDLLVRAGGEKNFTKTTPKIGIECYHDPVGKTLIVINEVGTIAVVPMPALANDRKAAWAFAHDLRARTAGEPGWKTSKPTGVEAFTYACAKSIIYASERKGLALADLPAQMGSNNGPSFHHGLVLYARAPGQAKFADAKTKIGVEAYKDGNTSGLIYITETGQLATGPAPTTPADLNAPKRPTPSYGFEPHVRKADEQEFTAKTKILSVEVFVDPNSGVLLYLSESGFLATAPAPKGMKDGQGLQWSHGMTLKARKGGEKDFSNAAKYGVEVFIDKNTGHLLYVTETGSVAVVGK